MSVLIPAFPRRGGKLRVGGLSVGAVARNFGTPLYVYDAAVLDDRVRAFQEAFHDLDFLLAYSVKANGNLAILDRIARLGAGADIVSGGELFRVLRAGIPAERIVFAGVGKTARELEAALDAGVRSIHVESEAELHLLDGRARASGRAAPVALRINPDVHAPTPHEYTRTGHAGSKFGIPVERALELYEWAADRDTLRIRGVDVHIGSQISETEPYERALDVALEVVDELREMGAEPEYVDLGGGFGVSYEGDDRLAPDALASAVVPRVRGAGLELILEPGRSVVGEAGILVTRVLHLKEQGGKTFVVTDAGMTDLLRPSHYDGHHAVEHVLDPGDRERRVVDVVGPVCETGDFLARDREMPLPEAGELLSVRTAGAYGFVMTMNYNGRPRPAEVLVEGDAAHLIRSREVYRDLIRGEIVPAYEGEGSPPPGGVAGQEAGEVARSAQRESDA